MSERSKIFFRELTKIIFAITGGFNTVGYGVCFMGDFTDHNPSEQAIVAYNSLVECAVNTSKIVEDYVRQSRIVNPEKYFAVLSPGGWPSKGGLTGAGLVGREAAQSE